jgi:deoxyribonuclease IV
MAFYFGGHIPREKGGLTKTLNKILEGGGNSLQIFAGNPHSGKVPKADYLSQGPEVKAFMQTHNMKLFIHSPYILNFAKDPGAEQPYWIESLWDELEIADALGAEGCVLHMGKSVKNSVEEAERFMVENLRTVVQRLRAAGIKAKVLVETAAGQGTELFATKDGTLDELARLFAKFSPEEKKHIGFCVDTCHIFAAGYDISTPQQVVGFFNEWEAKIGLRHLNVVHLNNSVKDLGSGVDRHACLAYGKIPIDGLATFISRAYSRSIPVILETPAPYQEIAYLRQAAHMIMTSAATDSKGSTALIRLPQDASRVVLLFDMGYLLFYRYHATLKNLALRNKDGTAQFDVAKEFEKHLEEQIKKTIKKLKVRDQVVFCKDAKRSTLWRNEIWPEYKANREKGDAMLPQLFPIMLDMCKKYGTVLECDRLEADDIAALAIRKVLELRPTQQIAVITNDRDYLQLITGENVRLFDGALKEIKGSGDHEADMWTKIMMGDKSDNIPPVAAKCGAKTAESLAKDAVKRDEYIAAKACREAVERNKSLICMSCIPEEHVRAFEATCCFSL